MNFRDYSFKTGEIRLFDTDTIFDDISLREQIEIWTTAGEGHLPNPANADMKFNLNEVQEDLALLRLSIIGFPIYMSFFLSYNASVPMYQKMISEAIEEGSLKPDLQLPELITPCSVTIQLKPYQNLRPEVAEFISAFPPQFAACWFGIKFGM